MIIAMDAATGKTKWKKVLPSAGRNPGSDKRSLFGVTPIALDGRVYAVGFCGALYCLDLKTGDVVWQQPNWKELEESKKKAFKEAAEGKGEIFGVAACPAGWLMAGDGVLVVPICTGNSPRAYGSSARGHDLATGKPLWDAPVNPNTLAPGAVSGKACLLSPRICIEIKTGKVLWKQEDQPPYYCPPSFGRSLLIHYVANPKSVELLRAKEGGDKKGTTAFGVLAGLAVDEKGATPKWTLPPMYRVWQLPDSGGFNQIAVRDGLVYHVSMYQEKEGAPTEKRGVIVQESDGKILASIPVDGWVPYLWGDRLITVTDIFHRPRAANAEIWQMYDANPSNFKPLGKGWHINGGTPVHVATGGYEMPVYEAFADGLAYFRVAGGIRCYDLRK